MLRSKQLQSLVELEDKCRRTVVLDLEGVRVRFKTNSETHLKWVTYYLTPYAKRVKSSEAVDYSVITVCDRSVGINASVMSSDPKQRIRMHLGKRGVKSQGENGVF